MMNKYYFFTLLMFCNSIATSGQSTIRITPQQVQQIDSLMNSLHESEKFNGLILVANGNEVIYSKGFGYANREKKIDNDPSYIFPIMSLTKQFTAALILKLVEEGKLDLNKPFVNYLPQYHQQHWRNITVHDLLRQTSGIPDYIPYLKAYDGSGGENKYHSPDTLVGKIANKPLNFQPGEKFQYCNVNYVLLGLIVERVTGKPIAEALSLYITRPLQLDHTGYDLNSLPRTPLTGSYYHKQEDNWTRSLLKEQLNSKEKNNSSLKNDTWTPTPTLHLSIPYSGGGMYSTVLDLFRFQQALNNGELLQTESVKKMYQSHVVVGDSGVLNYFKGYEETGYGYGVFVKQWPLVDNTTTLMVMAPGALPFGFYNHFVYFPEKKLYIVTVENSNQYFFPNDIINILIQNNSGTKQNKIR